MSGTTEAADRLAIEGLADTLDDNDWYVLRMHGTLTQHALVMSTNHPALHDTALRDVEAALLAHLREVADSLTEAQRDTLLSTPDASVYTRDVVRLGAARQAISALERRGLVSTTVVFVKRKAKGRAVAALLTGGGR